MECISGPTEVFIKVTEMRTKYRAMVNTIGMMAGHTMAIGLTTTCTAKGSTSGQMEGNMKEIM